MKTAERDALVCDAREVATSFLVLSHPEAERQAPVLFKDSLARIHPVPDEEGAATVLFDLPRAEDCPPHDWPSQGQVFDSHFQSLKGLRHVESGKSDVSVCGICMDEMWETTGRYDRNIVLRRCKRKNLAAFARIEFRQLVDFYGWACATDHQYGMAVANFARVLRVTPERVPLDGHKRSRHCMRMDGEC
jgi:hypothetical protein